MSRRGTSGAPLILGIIGGVVSIPNLLCASVCASAIAGATTNSSSAAGTGLLFGIVPIVTGIVAGCMGKSNPTVSGILFIISAVCSFITLTFTAFSSLFAWAALILFIIGAIIAFTQKKEGQPI